MLEQTLKQGIQASEEHRYDEAKELYNSILDEVQEKEKIYYNLGMNEKKRGDFEKAKEYYLLAIKENKDYIKPYLALYEVLVYLEDYFEAFKYQEYCFADNVLSHPKEIEKRLDFDDPWVKNTLNMRLGYETKDIAIKDDELKQIYSNILHKAEGKVINVISSQGLGDVIQCSIYIKELLKYNPKKVIFTVRAELIRVLYYLFNDDRIEVIDFHPLTEEIDYFIPIFSLAKLCGYKTMNSAWLEIDRRDEFFARSVLKSKIKRFNGKLIGIIYKGNPKHTNDAKRSVGLKRLLNMIDTENNAVISLQFDVTEEEKALMNQKGVLDFSNNIKDLYDIGSYQKLLDLFISVDSAPIHLAGALGVNSICLVPNKEEDYRWGRDKEKTLYETVKIVRF